MREKGREEGREGGRTFRGTDSVHLRERAWAGRLLWVWEVETAWSFSSSRRLTAARCQGRKWASDYERAFSFYENIHLLV